MNLPGILLAGIASILISYQGHHAVTENEDISVAEAHAPYEQLFTAQARVDASGGTLTENEMRLLLELTGWDNASIDTALLIAFCESKYSPYAIGDGGQSLGLFQLWKGWFPAFHYPVESWSNIIVNATVARLVYQKRGRFGGNGGWSCAPPGQ